MRLEVALRDRVAAELGDCERVQSWRPLAVRSSWTPELRAVLAAIDAGDLDATVTAVAAAEALAVELATMVAHRGASDVEGLRARVHDVALDADTATATRWAAIAEAYTVAATTGATIVLDVSAHMAADGYGEGGLSIEHQAAEGCQAMRHHGPVRIEPGYISVPMAIVDDVRFRRT